MKLVPTLLCDFYKISHREQYPQGTDMVYSTWTPRTSRMLQVSEVVHFGVQPFIQEWLVDFFNENFFGRSKQEVVAEYVRTIKYALGVPNPTASHIEYLHDLGYLPLTIKSLPEGLKVPLRVPTVTLENTDPNCFWLTNYIETLFSTENWKPSTNATLANEYRKILEAGALETVGDISFVQFQGHDFSMRGMDGVYAATRSGAAHLTSFVGTDTIPAIHYLEQFYGANIEKELVGTSIPATEHSVQCAYGNDDEYLRRMITEVYPNGFVSIVSDGYDFWDVIGRVVPSLKTEILARTGGAVGDKVVIRPDSGDPVKIVCGDLDAPEGSLQRKGAIEALWDIFGGTVSPQGFKVLNPKIGLIYGDAITLQRCEEICGRLKEKGFATVNVVYGIGSYTYQYNTRDTFGYAVKSSLVSINGVEKEIFKDPKTDNGIKKSLKGRVVVVRENGKLVAKDQQPNVNNQNDLLEVVFNNGCITRRQTLAEIRANVRA